MIPGRMPRIIVSASGCWLWTGATFLSGYPRWKQRGPDRDRAAHRVVWEIFNGVPFPVDMQADHLCRDKLCVNPAHIEPVTQSENNRRKWAARRNR